MKIFQLIYFLCLLGTIVFGDMPVVSIIIVRYIAVAALFAVCCSQELSYPRHSVYKAYFVFIFFFFITSLFYGYGEIFIKVFFGGYFVSIVWIWATYILIKKYNSLNVLITSLLIICSVNAVVTIAQYFKVPTSFAISYFLNVVDSDVIVSMEERAGASETFGGFAIYGIFGAVPNGYYSAVFSVISSILLYKSKTLIYKVASLSFWALALFALFCVQERAAFLGGVFFSGLCLIKMLSANEKGRVLMSLIILVSFFLLMDKGASLFSFAEGTRYESFDLDTRTYLFVTSKEYVLNHLFTANLFEYVDTYNKFPHHIIYYSFMCGTCIGGIIILGALAYILFLALKLSVKRVDDNNVGLMMASFSLFAYIVPSLTHNDSIASGATLFWILAAAVITEDMKSRKRRIAPVVQPGKLFYKPR